MVYRVNGRRACKSFPDLRACYDGIFFLIVPPVTGLGQMDAETWPLCRGLTPVQSALLVLCIVESKADGLCKSWSARRGVDLGGEDEEQGAATSWWVHDMSTSLHRTLPTANYPFPHVTRVAFQTPAHMQNIPGRVLPDPAGINVRRRRMVEAWRTRGMARYPLWFGGRSMSVSVAVLVTSRGFYVWISGNLTFATW